ncbi:MAG: hypothetical protein WDM81_00850 [Rhizomicrobium sp.]
MPEFTEQEGIGGKMVGEKTLLLGGGKTPISVYQRTYETAALRRCTTASCSRRGRSAIGRWRRRSNSPPRATTRPSRASSTPSMPRRWRISPNCRRPSLRRSCPAGAAGRAGKPALDFA